MKVQELIDRLADFRQDAEVIFWIHGGEGSNKEFANPIFHVARDNQGCVGINWNEDASINPSIELIVTND